MADFSDKVFIITGATGNLGQSVTKALAAQGAKLALVDRMIEDRFAGIFPDLVDDPACFFAHSTDLTNPDTVKRLVTHVNDHFGQIDGLVNIVGGYRAGKPVHETDLATFDFMFDINAKTVLLMSQAVVPLMIAQGMGKIVNIGAKVALGGTKNHSAYSIAKTAVVRLTESLSAEVKAHNINVNAVLPSTIDTPQNREAMPNADYDRWVAPEALADVILFLLSESSRAVHGAAIPVFGKG